MTTSLASIYPFDHWSGMLGSLDGVSRRGFGTRLLGPEANIFDGPVNSTINATNIPTFIEINFI